MTKSLLSGCAVAVCATGILLSMERRAQADGWQISKVSGEAWETTGGSHKPLAVGATLDENATIVTGQRSRVMLVRRTETMVVGPVSVVAISEHPDQQLSTTVLQKGGTVTFDVEKRNVQHFSVETPMLAAVVKGTHFTVVVGRATGDVSVDRGTVQVTALASGQTTAITQGQRAAVDQRGLSVSGQGRPAPVTRTQPRAALVSPLSEVTPATTVSVGEFAAAQRQQAPQAPARNPGLFSATLSLFSATSLGNTDSKAAAAPTAAGTASGDRSAHTSASTPASGNSTPTQSTGGFATGIGGTGSTAAGAGGSPAAVGSSMQGSPAGIGSGTAGAPAVSGGSSGKSDQGQGNGGTPGNGGQNGSAGSPGSPGSSGQGQGNGGPPGNGSQNGSAGSPGSSGKSDQGKGNGGTPGNGGQNGSAGSPGSSGKSDQGKGNGGTPGNGGVNNGAGASGKSSQGQGNGGTPGKGNGHQNS